MRIVFNSQTREFHTVFPRKNAKIMFNDHLYDDCWFKEGEILTFKKKTRVFKVEVLLSL